MTNDVFNLRGQKAAAAFRHLDPNESISEGMVGGFSVLHYKSQAFSLKHKGQFYPIMREDGSQANVLDVIILNVSPHISKTYYPGPYVPETSAGRPPVCKSGDGITPDRDAQIKQSNLCGTCKHNQWRTDGRGKDCRDQKRTAVMLMPGLTKKLLGAPLLEPVQLTIPPGSFNSWTTYGNMLKHEGVHYATVVTRVAFNPNKQFEMTFTPTQMLSDKEAGLVLELREGPQAQRIVGTAPAITHVKEPDTKPARMETGLVEAFDTQKQEVQQEAVKTAPKGNGGGNDLAIPGFLDRSAPDVPTHAADSSGDLDQEVAALLAKKVEDMLK